MRMRLSAMSGDSDQRASMPAHCPYRAPSLQLSPARRAAARRLRSTHTCCRCKTGLQTLPGAHWMATGSQASVWQSSFQGPTSSQVQACQSWFGASTMGERSPWLEVICVSISSNYPVSAMLIHPRALLAASRGAEAVLNHENN